MTSTSSPTEKPSAAVIVSKIEECLEERKQKKDRRQADSSKFPASLERRSGQDRRHK